MRLEAVEVPHDHLRYTRVSWSELIDAEFDALERGEVTDLKYPGECTDRGQRRTGAQGVQSCSLLGPFPAEGPG